jgi:hypothetical protein
MLTRKTVESYRRPREHASFRAFGAEVRRFLLHTFNAQTRGKDLC